MFIFAIIHKGSKVLRWEELSMKCGVVRPTWWKDEAHTHSIRYGITKCIPNKTIYSSEKREGWFEHVRTHTPDPSEDFSMLRCYRSGCRILKGGLWLAGVAA